MIIPLHTAVLLLLQQFDWTIFDNVDNLYSLVLGKLLMISWTIFAAIVMANLLIALVSQKYKPDEVDRQSKFQQAKKLSHYQFLVIRS